MHFTVAGSLHTVVCTLGCIQWYAGCTQAACIPPYWGPGLTHTHTKHALYLGQQRGPDFRKGAFPRLPIELPLKCQVANPSLPDDLQFDEVKWSAALSVSRQGIFWVGMSYQAGLVFFVDCR